MEINGIANALAVDHRLTVKNAENVKTDLMDMIAVKTAAVVYIQRTTLSANTAMAMDDGSVVFRHLSGAKQIHFLAEMILNAERSNGFK